MSALDINTRANGVQRRQSWVGLCTVLIKVGFKAVKIGKAIKIALAGGSYAAYAYLWSPWFAALLIFALVCHEYGHVWAMRRCGMRTKGFYLIPFIGGAAIADDGFRHRQDIVFVSMAGPLAGALSIVPLAGMLFTTGAPIWAGTMSFVAMMNLLNLLPVNPLDGGRVWAAIGFSLSNRMGLITGISMAAVGASIAAILGSGLLVAVVIIGAIEVAFDYRHRSRFVMPMNRWECFHAFILWVSACAVFITIISLAALVPSADIALEVIR